MTLNSYSHILDGQIFAFHNPDEESAPLGHLHRCPSPHSSAGFDPLTGDDVVNMAEHLNNTAPFNQTAGTTGARAHTHAHTHRRSRAGQYRQIYPRTTRSVRVQTASEIRVARLERNPLSLITHPFHPLRFNISPSAQTDPYKRTQNHRTSKKKLKSTNSLQKE